MASLVVALKYASSLRIAAQPTRNCSNTRNGIKTRKRKNAIATTAIVLVPVIFPRRVAARAKAVTVIVAEEEEVVVAATVVWIAIRLAISIFPAIARLKLRFNNFITLSQAN